MQSQSINERVWNTLCTVKEQHHCPEAQGDPSIYLWLVLNSWSLSSGTFSESRLNDPFNDPETFKTILSQWLWQSVSVSSRHGPSCQASMGLFQEQTAFSFPHACQSLTVMTALCLTSHSHLGAGHLPPERCLNSKFTTMRHDPIGIVWLSLTRSSSRVPTLNWNNLNGNQSCSQYRSISCQQFSCL